MKIDYKKILFNTNYINFVFKIVVIVTIFNIFLVISVSFILNNFEKRINEKYTFDVVKYYLKGMVINPHAFLESAKVYRSVGRFHKEKEDLEFALNLYLNMPVRDEAMIANIRKRIQKINLEKSD